VLLFGEMHDPVIHRQLVELKKDKKGMLDRDLKIFFIAEKEVEEIFTDVKPIFSTDELREKFNVDKKDFQYLLIGKDGGVKIRQNRFLPNEQLFATIDAMPMRRQEMRYKDNNTP
jgi:hypothetical protein